MSGPKKWVSSKVHRKTSSKSSLNSYQSSSSPLEDDRTPPSPPTRLPKDDVTVATSIVDFGSGSTLGSQTRDDQAVGPSGNSSIDSNSTGLTPSPSTTPPKKSWEMNYKSFLKRSSKHSKATTFPSGGRAHNIHTIPLKPLPIIHAHKSKKPTRSFSETATNLLSKSHQENPKHPSGKNDDFHLCPSLADGFGDYSPQKHAYVGHATVADNHSKNSHKIPFTAPPSPSKPKEFSSRSGAFFKRVRSKAKSVDNLDASMKKGIDRKSPTNTPPGSAASTPINRSSPLTPSLVLTSMQDGVEKAAMLSDFLSPPDLASSSSLASHRNPKLGPKPLPKRVLSSQRGLNDDNLDQARHRGHSSTAAKLFTRVQSAGSNLIIPEGKPVDNSIKEEQLAREKRKAFTDFHNMGIDSSSAYLGDESSLHKHSLFLSSMAYPAGSAGGTAAHSRHTFCQSGPHSLDLKKPNISPSTSMNAISETAPQHKESGDQILQERALRSLKGTEHWNKGERHAIFPGVLSMCPIQILNQIMSSEEGTSTPNLTSRGSQRGFGIGSIISEDEGLDSNGWFFADHNQSTPSGGTLPRNGSVNNHTMFPPAFGKILLGKATVASLGMRSFLNEVYGWCAGTFVLRQNYLFEYREGDSVNGLPWGYAHLTLAEAYPHKHFTNALHLDFFERPCCKSGKRSLLMRVESKAERDRWVSLLQTTSRMTMHDLYDVDESDGAPSFGSGRYAVVRPAKRKQSQKVISNTDVRYLHATNSQGSFQNVSSYESLGICSKSSNNELDKNAAHEYECALKIIDKREFWSRVKKGRERADTLVREAAVQTTLAVKGGDTPGFLRLLNIFETGEKLVLELELLKGIDLFQHISSRGVLSEVEAAHIMKDLLSCLNVMDQVGIAHRDIKPANLLMCHDEDINGTKIKLADYGMASFVGVDNLVRGRCGTPGFVAPEILRTGVNGGYGNKVDMFSAGVTLYVMLSGYEPFYGESDEELIEANRQAKVNFPHSDWQTVSIEGRDLIEKMLEVDPLRRIGPSEALKHPWITRRAIAPTLQNEDCAQPQQVICH